MWFVSLSSTMDSRAACSESWRCCGRVHFGEGDAAVGEAVGRIEHAEAEARAEEAAECDVEVGFGDEVAVDGVDEGGEGLAVAEAALEIGAGFDGVGSGVGHVGSVVVAGVDVGDGGAVADDVAGEGPGVAKVIVQEHGVGAGGRAVDGVVGAHDGLRVGLGDGGAEGGEVGVFEVVRGDVDVGLMARGLRAGVHGEVLGRGDDAEVVGVGALHAGDEGDGHAAGEEGIFAVGLLAAAPARVAKDVDVGRPEGEAEELLVLIVADGFVVLGAGFGGDDLGLSWWISGVSQVAAMPMTCGKLVASPAKATPCRPSFHQSYAGTPRRGMAGAWSRICWTFSSSVIWEMSELMRSSRGADGFIQGRSEEVFDWARAQSGSATRAASREMRRRNIVARLL